MSVTSAHVSVTEGHVIIHQMSSRDGPESDTAVHTSKHV